MLDKCTIGSALVVSLLQVPALGGDVATPLQQYLQTQRERRASALADVDRSISLQAELRRQRRSERAARQEELQQFASENVEALRTDLSSLSAREQQRSAARLEHVRSLHASQHAEARARLRDRMRAALSMGSMAIGIGRHGERLDDTTQKPPQRHGNAPPPAPEDPESAGRDVSPGVPEEPLPRPGQIESISLTAERAGDLGVPGVASSPAKFTGDRSPARTSLFTTAEPDPSPASLIGVPDENSAAALASRVGLQFDDVAPKNAATLQGWTGARTGREDSDGYVELWTHADGPMGLTRFESLYSSGTDATLTLPVQDGVAGVGVDPVERKATASAEACLSVINDGRQSGLMTKRGAGVSLAIESSLLRACASGSAGTTGLAAAAGITGPSGSVGISLFDEPRRSEAGELRQLECSLSLAISSGTSIEAGIGMRKDGKWGVGIKPAFGITPGFEFSIGNRKIKP